MSYGRYWKVGLSDPGRLRATDKQLRYLKRLDRRDYSNKGLTVDQASDLIDELVARRSEAQGELGSVAERMFNALYKKAVDEANAAGAAWLQRHPNPIFIIHDPDDPAPRGVHGQIGAAWLSYPKRGTPLYKWIENTMYDGQKKVMNIAHRYAHRPEVGLQLACERAAIQTYRAGGLADDVKLFFRCSGDPDALEL
jgi:hypothetical protein